MARVTHVKKAQQRYAQVTVKNPDGSAKQVPVMRRNGTQKVTKRGRAVFMTIKVADKTKPLPMPKCDKCGKTIEVGQPYKHVTPKSGPYGGRTRYRCGSCPTWHVWELSSSLSARLAEVSYNFDQAQGAGFESADEVTEALSAAAEEIRQIAEEKREGASNIEEGFGHETQQSQELNDIADQLESWADEVESAEVPDYPEPEEQDCEECDATGQVECDACNGTGQDENDKDLRCGKCNDEDGKVECETCEGTGTMTPDEPTDEQLDEWHSEVESACSIVNESPV